MQQQQQSGSSSYDPALAEGVGQRMKTPTGAIVQHLAPVSPEDEDPIEDLLVSYDFHYILERVKKTIPKYPTIRHMPEEIASEVYDNFWQKLVKGPVEKPPAYISMMIRNKCIDYARRNASEASHMVQPSTREGLDILESDQVLADSEGLRDPADEFEENESLLELMDSTASAVATLSPRQQQAMICDLNEKVGKTMQLVQALRRYKVEVRTVDWPEDEADKKLLKASLSAARHKMVECLGSRFGLA